MFNMVKIVNQFDQKIRPVYYDDGVFQILRDIFLQNV